MVISRQSPQRERIMIASAHLDTSQYRGEIVQHVPF